jgi:SAM-dependent methyltransferase
VFSESAHFYDAIYGAFKNYAAESAIVATLLREVHPAPHTILDVACGTGEHVKFLRRDHGFSVDGLDLDPGLLEVARTKVPEAQFFEADMSGFDLRKQFDVVLCLFSSVGYLRSLDRLTGALRCFKDHTAPDGVVVVEPWFAPGVLREGSGQTRRAQADGKWVERTSHTEVEGRLSRLTFDYRIEDPVGDRVVQEVHELGLFTVAEMMSSFEAAGLAATHDPAGLADRGLYVARVPPTVRSPRLRS